MKRLIIPTLISLITINLSTGLANATSNDYVVLESIRAINTTLTLEDDLVYELTVSTPSTFAWDPRDSNWDGYLRIVVCKTEMIIPESNPIQCNYQNLQSRFLLTQIRNIATENQGTRTYIKFEVFGKPVNYGLGEFFVYLVRIPNARATDPDETNLYHINRANAFNMFEEPVLPIVPSYQNTYINVLNEIPEPEPEPIIELTPEPVIEDASEPVVPTPRIVSAVPSTTNQTPITQPVIQSNFYLPALKGDENWKPMKEIKGNFQDWKRIKKNSINGSMNQVTKIDGALITFTSSGDALTLRFMGGKKRGSFSIYVNGKFIERVDTKRNKKTQLMKTWQGLGSGKHFIDIVAELDNRQSLALNGIQSPRT